MVKYHALALITRIPAQSAWDGGEMYVDSCQRTVAEAPQVAFSAQ